MRTIRLTLSKNELELGDDGRWRYKVLKREEFATPEEYLPVWWGRLIELRAKGLTYGLIAEQLRAEGYTAKQGGPLWPSTLIQLYHYHTKRKRQS